ncbi:cobyrinate a,c-diamide synthase [Vibrio tritonius]|uniref:cobyrinate a,c-diamide synthase n=1 Tax=Vibrio tritonius TaxID=1435069 RepID=UPI00315CB3A3
MKAFVIAGTNSGCGKTTMTLGLLKALTNRGLAVQPYKVGPDYIDTAWHTRVSGVASRNLDAFMLPAETMRSLFYSHTSQADIAVIEGVMGLYDGYGVDPHYCSTAGLARDLNLPVILVVDGRAVSTSAAATVMGFQHFDPELNIAGVIFNNVNSDSHLDLIHAAVEKYCQIPVLGRLPKLPEIELPERHLGLLTAQESARFDPHWQTLAEAIEEHIDLDALLALSEIEDQGADINEFAFPDLNALPESYAESDQEADQAGAGLTIALAHDNAFNFYYQDNLDLLEQHGAAIVRFSPLDDEAVPECDLVYIGGGYPESYGAALAQNSSMLASLRMLHQQGTPIYAECGGLMYLGDSLTTYEDTHPMVGILPGCSTMTKSLKRFGYCFATANTNTVICPQGTVLRGHEFHYSEFTTELEPVFDMTKERDGDIISRWGGGYQVGNTLATYLHLHFAQQPELIKHWFALAKENQLSRTKPINEAIK